MNDPNLPIMAEKFAPIKSAAQISMLVRTLQNRHPDLPGFGVVHGKAGLGKTKAAIRMVGQSNAVLIRMWDHSTRKSLFQDICTEIGETKPGNTVGAMFQTVVQHFAMNWTRPLIIDEADKIIGRRLFESVRDLHDAARMPVILIGEPRLPKLLEREERFHSRILAMQEIGAADISDVRKLADVYCGENLKVSEDLLARIHEATAGNVRRIATSLQAVIDWAQRQGARAVSAVEYDGVIMGAPVSATRISRRAA